MLLAINLKESFVWKVPELIQYIPRVVFRRGSSLLHFATFVNNFLETFLLEVFSFRYSADVGPSDLFRSGGATVMINDTVLRQKQQQNRLYERILFITIKPK